MLKIRRAIILLGLLWSSMAAGEMNLSIGIEIPSESIGIDILAYPELDVVPGYPVYYAPDLDTNYFFYDGMYWVYQDDNWYTSSWYDGPWWIVDPDDVPVFILRVPIRYYNQPPFYFREWRPDAPPHWGDHWGRDWEQHRRGWDRWNPRAVPLPAPLPLYQRHYSGDRYPRFVEQQRELERQRYRYRPHDPDIRRHWRDDPANSRFQSHQRYGEGYQQSAPDLPQRGRINVQPPPGQFSQPEAGQREQWAPSSRDRQDYQDDGTRMKRMQEQEQEQMQEQQQDWSRRR